MIKNCIKCLVLFFLFSCNTPKENKIDRFSLTQRNNPIVHEFNKLASLSVGNGNLAFTVDATGLQTFPELYSKGVPLGTQSQWGWHKFPNPNHYKFEETLKEFDFKGKKEIYAVEFKEPGRQKDAANWYRGNPHRLHLGYVGLELTDKDGKEVSPDDIKNIQQELKLWNGVIASRFSIGTDSVSVKTACSPKQDLISATLASALMAKNQMSIKFQFAYPTGKHSDDATNWDAAEKHHTEIVELKENTCLLKRTLDSTEYYISIKWQGQASFVKKEEHYFNLIPQDSKFAFTCEFSEKPEFSGKTTPQEVLAESSEYWENFWQNGGAVDFSKCTDERAKELERRIVLSQYLMAIQSAGDMPPQETGLTYNSWFGKFHLEMHWWHQSHFALWNHVELLERSLNWYNTAYPVAKSIAERQGFEGVRWMKMTDPSALEAPSSVGSFLIWQQPHYIYFAEQVYKNKPNAATLDKYAFLVEETAKFMASFVTYDTLNDRYILTGIIPAQETLRASETVNPPFELAQWHYALQVAQTWRERTGKQRDAHWDDIINKFSSLTQLDGLYLASEDAVETYKDIRFTSDHPAVLGAYGMFPKSELVRADYMQNTLNWIWDNWNWEKTWGWDYPMTAMCAARLGDTEKAVGALLMDKRTNTYLINGHNYQDDRLRVYLPGNGGLLTAVAMMCAGWEGCETESPGFPKNGKWDVMWENLSQMP